MRAEDGQMDESVESRRGNPLLGLIILALLVIVLLAVAHILKLMGG